MRIRNILSGYMLLAVALAFPSAAQAQDYPNKPIKVVVPFPPGSGLDRVARIAADKLNKKWGQPVIVENRSGAGGNLGAETVFRAAPDGYTLLVSPPSPLVINKSLYPKLAYDSDAFVPISVLASLPNVLIVHPKMAAESVQQLIAFAKANPDKINYASQGSGTTPHLAAELFKSMAGLRMSHVPYRGVAPALTDLMGGQVDMMFADLASALPQIRAGKVRVLAVGSEKRSPLLPDVPAMAEVLPGFVSMLWYGMVAPPKTPPDIVKKLSDAIMEGMKDPAVMKTLLDMSAEVVAGTPAEMALFMKQEGERWGNVIRATGVTAE
jgi:tripartite-type tricarboxylate transporter receptor subunit TctC